MLKQRNKEKKKFFKKLMPKWCLQVEAKTWTAFCCLLLLIQFNQVNCKLNVFVRNDGKEVFKEMISVNESRNLINFEYTDPDGSFIHQIVDFQNELQVFKIIMLGEMDKNEKIFQAFCFLTSLNNNYIASDSLAKLRQHNPNTIRVAEYDKGRDTFDMDLNMESEKASTFSTDLKEFCKVDNNSINIFANKVDLKNWAMAKQTIDVKLQSLVDSFQRSSDNKTSILCKDSKVKLKDSKSGIPCTCQVEICIPWYPCALKSCKGKDIKTGKLVTYRCGIKACTKCSFFNFYVQDSRDCLSY